MIKLGQGACGYFSSSTSNERLKIFNPHQYVQVRDERYEPTLCADIAVILKGKKWELN